MKKILLKAKGITLIALVITIIIIIILTGITINLTIGENGIFTKSKQAREAYQKQTAKETINLKITNIQMETYAKEQRLPTLKNIADAFCRDGDFEHVTEVSQRRASNNESPFLLPEIQNANPSSIFVELKAYPYEFEIDNQLRLASIDGEKIAGEPMGNYASQSDYEELSNKYSQLESNYNQLQANYNSIQSELNSLKTTVNTLQNGATLKDKSEVLWTGDIVAENATASWTKSLEDYSYLVLETRWATSSGRQEWLIDVQTIKDIGYFSNNYSGYNSHMVICMYDVYFLYVTFTSNKSLVISARHSDNTNVNHIVKIVGIK